MTHPDEIASPSTAQTVGTLVAVRFVWQHLSSGDTWIDTLGMPWFWSFAEARNAVPDHGRGVRLAARHMYDVVVTE
jgi:hypothetical protein